MQICFRYHCEASCVEPLALTDSHWRQPELARSEQLLASSLSLGPWCRTHAGLVSWKIKNICCCVHNSQPLLSLGPGTLNKKCLVPSPNQGENPRGRPDTGWRISWDPAQTWVIASFPFSWNKEQRIYNTHLVHQDALSLNMWVRHGYLPLEEDPLPLVSAQNTSKAKCETSSPASHRVVAGLVFMVARLIVICPHHPLPPKLQPRSQLSILNFPALSSSQEKTQADKVQLRRSLQHMASSAEIFVGWIFFVKLVRWSHIFRHAAQTHPLGNGGLEPPLKCNRGK